MPITSRSVAERVLDRFYANPKVYRFLPLIAFEKRVRRWRYDRKTRKSSSEWKVRPLAYCSNSDTHVFAAINLDLSTKYEDTVKQCGLDDVVIGYRPKRSNITSAGEVFEEIQKKGECSVLALDIEQFFPTINHKVLKRCWEQVAGQSLPASHYAVYKAITDYAQVDRRRCAHRLNLKNELKAGRLPKPLCTMETFRTKIRSTHGRTLVAGNSTPGRGIPQGTPISAVAANVSMLAFDKHIYSEVKKLHGLYRRYSDDILLLVPTDKVEQIKETINAALTTKAGGLRLNEKKEQRVDFSAAPLNAQTKELQYLGFLFNGQRALLRPSTISKYFNRITREVRWAKSCHASNSLKKSQMGNRIVLQRKTLVFGLTHVGRKSFYRSYASSAATTLSAPGIKRQLRNHMRHIGKLTKD